MNIKSKIAAGLAVVTLAASLTVPTSAANAGGHHGWGIAGAVIGGAIVAYLPVRFTGIAEYKYLIFGIALILLMLFRSEGLMPARMHLLTYAKRAYQKATGKEIVAPESEDNPFAGDSKTLNLATEKEADEK